MSNVVINMPDPRPPPRRWPWLMVATATAVTAVVVIYSRPGAPPPTAQPAPPAQPPRSRTAPASPAAPVAISGSLRVSHSTIATGLDLNGTYDVFGIDTRGHIVRSEIGSADDDPGPWTAFGPDGTTVAVTAAADSDGLLHVMAVMADGSIQQRSEETSGQWGDWQLFAAGGTAKTLALGLDRHSHLNVFAVSPEGHLTSEQQLDSGSWSGWAAVSVPGRVQSVTARQKADYYLDVVAVLTDGTVEWEDENRVGFRPWVRLGPPGTAVETSLGQNGYGGLTIYALTPNGSISDIHQETAYDPQIPTGHRWSAWAPDFQPCCTAASVSVGAKYEQQPTVLVVNTDGTMRFFDPNPADGSRTGGWKVFGPDRGFAAAPLTD